MRRERKDEKAGRRQFSRIAGIKRHMGQKTDGTICFLMGFIREICQRLMRVKAAQDLRHQKQYGKKAGLLWRDKASGEAGMIVQNLLHAIFSAQGYIVTGFVRQAKQRHKIAYGCTNDRELPSTIVGAELQQVFGYSEG